MLLNNMKIKTRMLSLFITTIVVLVTTAMLIISSLSKSSITNSLMSVFGQIAADAMVAGVPLEDQNEVAYALQAFTTQDLFSYIKVMDKTGTDIFYYRKAGLADPELSGTESMVEVGEEMFNRVPVKSNGSAQEMSSTAQELSSQAAQLEDSISFFALTKTQSQSAGISKGPRKRFSNGSKVTVVSPEESEEFQQELAENMELTNLLLAG